MTMSPLEGHWRLMVKATGAQLSLVEQRSNEKAIWVKEAVPMAPPRVDATAVAVAVNADVPLRATKGVT